MSPNARSLTVEDASNSDHMRDRCLRSTVYTVKCRHNSVKFAYNAQSPGSDQSSPKGMTEQCRLQFMVKVQDCGIIHELLVTVDRSWHRKATAGSTWVDVHHVVWLAERTGHCGRTSGCVYEQEHLTISAQDIACCNANTRVYRYIDSALSVSKSDECTKSGHLHRHHQQPIWDHVNGMSVIL